MIEQLGEYIEKAPLIAVVLSFAGGLLTSFTPCVYPVIPITVGVIGARQTTSRWQSFAMSFVYVLGMALVYSVLGMTAALSGHFFGEISVHPVTNIIVGNICILFALNMFDVFEIPLPGFLTQRKGAAGKKKGYIGLFIMGATSGSIVAPCTAPVLGTLLAFVSQSQNLFYGFILLFSFSLGLGTLFILIGVFSNIVTALPKSGTWMVTIKRILAALLMVVGEFFLLRAGGLV